MGPVAKSGLVVGIIAVVVATGIVIAFLGGKRATTPPPASPRMVTVTVPSDPSGTAKAIGRSLRGGPSRAGL